MATSEGPFRIYVLDDSGAARHVASCDDDSLGFCLLTLYEEGQIEDRPVGIMHRPNPGVSGDWLINPYGKRLKGDGSWTQRYSDSSSLVPSRREDRRST